MTLADFAPVANHLWQSTVFVGVVWLLSLLLKNNRAAVRYWLWLSGSLKFLIPFSALVAMGRTIEWRRVAAAQPDISYVIDAFSQPFARSGIAAASTAPTPFSLASFLPMLVLFAWCAGTAMHLIAWWVRWRRVAMIVRPAMPLEHGRELDLLRHVEGVLRLRQPIAAVTTNISIEPGIFGIITPVLLWPRGIGERLSDGQVEALLTHELCHVRRRDNLAAALHMAVEAAFWFHPVVWWIERRLVEEREHACDEEVIRLGSDPQLYAESILKTCEFRAESPLVCVAGITGSDLKKRVEAIMRDASRKRVEIWKRVILVAVAVAILATPVGLGISTAFPQQAQAPAVATDPEFEVASIKPNRSGERAGGMRMLPSGQVTVTNMPLRILIRTVYQLEDFQISGGPGWMDSERFNIDAKGATNVPPAQTMQMMRSLLADRFKLVARQETRDLPVYSLVVSRRDGALGPRLRKAQIEECPPRPMGSLAGAVPDRREPPCGVLLFGGPGTEGSATGKTVPIAQLASRLAPLVRRKVIDGTGLGGRFDLDLEFSPTDTAAPGGSSETIAGTPSIFTALQEQLGLRLESARGPVDVLVIESVQRPTDDAAIVNTPIPQVAARSAQPQPPSASDATAFEVVSIKPSKLRDDRVISSTLPNRYTSINITPQMLILTAYQLQAGQLTGGPAWITSGRFDIEAKSERAFSVQELFPMLQNLLAVDFGLMFHHETRAIPAYSLVLTNARVKTGRLKPGSTATCASGQQPRRGPQNPDALLACGAVQVSPGHWTARSVPMTRLVNYLAGRVSRVVVDRTGLEGLFDVELDYTPDRIPPGALGNGSDRDFNAPSLFTALQEQLGLRLESSKSPVAVMVIDRIDRPTEH